VNSAFGRNLEFDDIYQHITSPESLYLLRQNKLVAMAAYTGKQFSSRHCLYVDGIAISPEMQGKGVFKAITLKAMKESYDFICLRTQNPRMYRALEKCCSRIFPGSETMPQIVKAIILDMAKDLNCSIDGNGVVKSYYGGLFYGIEPHHKKIDPLFKELGLNLHNGDGLLVTGETE